MRDLKEFIESGILEMYVLGNTTSEESLEVNKMKAIYPEIHDEIESISSVLENIALSNAVTPEITVKPFILATLDYISRLEAGEIPAEIPELNEASNISDYKSWLDREEFQLPESSEDIFAHIVSKTPTILTAIVWLKNGAPGEVHNDEYEKFLIVEGTCDITIGEQIHSLKPGSFLSIPLHIDHNVRVTSSETCKIILQRVAA